MPFKESLDITYANYYCIKCKNTWTTEEGDPKDYEFKLVSRCYKCANEETQQKPK